MGSSHRSLTLRLGFAALVAGWVGLAAFRGGYATGSNPHRRIAGEVQVLDGDTYRLKSGELLRLLGADTPERSAPWFEGDQEPWASRASAFAEARIAGAQRVEILSHGERDAHGRLLGHVVLDGVPLAALLVAEGLAYPTLARYGDGGFPAEARQVESVARQPGFEAPWLWRRRQRREAK